MSRRASPKVSFRFPAEWEPHECCWMAWAIHREWSANDAMRIRRDLARVATTIARFEPIRLLAPPGRAYCEARERFSDYPAVTVVKAPVDDFWMRDVMPTFAIRTEGCRRQVVAVDWHFNGWGNTPDRRTRRGDRLAKIADRIFGVPRLSAPFVAEGGALAFDGRGTVITTRSCLLNPNRNPVGFRRDRQRFIVSGFRTLGIRKVIWLEGDSCEPITSGHIDGYVVFAPGNLILVEVIDETDAERPFWREHDTDLLRKAKNARSLGLKIIDVLAPRERYLSRHSGSFAANYLNVYIANGAVIVSQFGDPKRDALVQERLAYAFPGREIVALKIDAISAGGGGVHCLTQSMPLVKKSEGE